MRIHHLRNATTVLTLGDRTLLIDPMLGPAGHQPGLRFLRGVRRRNPLVELPTGADEVLGTVTDVLITHEHPDHLDREGLTWIRRRRLPVWGSSLDVPHLRRRGLDARVLRDGDLGCRVERVPAAHGRGLLGWLMGPVSGFYLAHPAEPSLFLTSDAVWTESLASALDRLRPDVVLAPAGSANFGVGGDILFSLDELVELARHAPARVIFDHLEAMDHCPVTRRELRDRLETAGLMERVWIPEDGEARTFSGAESESRPEPGPPSEPRPDFRKWLTSRFA